MTKNNDDYSVDPNDQNQLKDLKEQIDRISGAKYGYGFDDFGKYIPDNVQLMRKIVGQVGILLDFEFYWSE